MKKLFISQPMNNLSEEVIKSERDKAVAEAKKALGEDVEVIDTYFTENYEKPLEFIAKSIEKLAEADIAYFATGWSTARGCRIEHMCAKEYGIPTIEAYK